MLDSLNWNGHAWEKEIHPRPEFSNIMSDIPRRIKAAEDKYHTTKNGGIKREEKKKYRSIEEIEKSNQFIHESPPGLKF